MIKNFKINSEEMYKTFNNLFEMFNKRFGAYGDEISDVIERVYNLFNNKDYTRLFDILDMYVNDYQDISLYDLYQIFNGFFDKEIIKNIKIIKGYYVDSEDFYHHNILSALIAEYLKTK